MIVIAIILLFIGIGLAIAVVRAHREHEDALNVIHGELSAVAKELRGRLYKLEGKLDGGSKPQ